jgi:6-phospho-beta-glucosidase
MQKGFQKDFLWGSSTNAQQFEGGWDEAGRGPSIADVRQIKGMLSLDEFKTASDHYHHYKEDIALLGEMGFGIYRFTISWSRIFPNGNDAEPNEEGLQFYERVLDELEKYNIKPVVTLYAYDLPLALVEQYGGWTSRQCIDDYLRYAETVFKRYKGRVKFWVPFNETNAILLDPEYMIGVKDLSKKERYQVDHHFTVAYAKATKLLHSVDPDAQIGPNCLMASFYPLTCDPKDARAASDTGFAVGYRYMDTFVHKAYPQYFLRELEEKGLTPEFAPGDLEAIETAEPDFISVTYYMSKVVRAQEADHDINVLFNRIPNPYCKASEWGWTIDPEGFYLMLKDVYHRYRMPILILENGLGHRDEVTEDGKVHDEYRIAYLRDHIAKLKEAVMDGVNVLGYLTWSAFDLFSTREGFEKRYGFVYVNRGEKDNRDMKRLRKDSFFWYKKVIASNGEDLSSDV